MYLKKIFKIGGGILSLTAFATICYAQFTNGSITIDPCAISTEGCLYLSTPESLTRVDSRVVFIKNENNSIYYYTSSLGKQITINDATTLGHFKLDIDSSNLRLNTNSNIIEIPKTNIGILTYNESNNSSIDGSNISGNPLPTSNIDPVSQSITSEPFDETTYLENIANNTISQTPYFHFFSNTPINIINANSAPSYLGNYSFGLGLIIHLSSTAIQDYNLLDGTYSGQLTFTISPLWEKKH